ncbi:hypothetical protein ANTQUA_LOCUS8641 [Anthophora quadrimaculata]
MWVPVISILWTIVNLVHRKLTMKSVMYSTLDKTAGECDQFVKCNNVEIITDFVPRPTRKHAGRNIVTDHYSRVGSIRWKKKNRLV